LYTFLVYILKSPGSYDGSMERPGDAGWDLDIDLIYKRDIDPLAGGPGQLASICVRTEIDVFF
jgi:hypothetical protein